ncbi:MAG TPA: hypothetical protein VKU02_02955 [Gemmataceae bacterium]|nr:hypothetical protein [Gemmataceae bacterium]
MTRPKTRLAGRPHLENLESRLQPGSIIVGQGYGWSLLADNLLNLGQGTLASESLISQASSESSRRFRESGPSNVPEQNIAIAPVMVVRSQPTSLPISNLVENVTASLSNDDLGLLALAGRRNAGHLVAAPEPVTHSPSPTPIRAGFVESPIGVATPAQPALGSQTHSGAFAPSVSGKGSAATGTQVQGQPIPLSDAHAETEATHMTVAARPVANLHVTVTHLTANGVHAFASQPVWATYLGSSGEDRVLSVALSPVPGAAQPIVVTGFTQSPNDPTEFDALLATLSTDGKSATVMTIGSGTGTRTEGHGVDVDAAGNLYLTGQTGQTGVPATTTDLTMRVEPTGTVDWSVAFGATGAMSVGNSVKLDSTGTNLYMGGGQQLPGDVENVLVVKMTNLNAALPSTDPSTGGYATVFTFAPPNNTASREINSIAVDSQGHADYAFSRHLGPDVGAGYAQVTLDGSSVNSTYFTSTGGKGGAFGVTVDASDDFYITGAVGNPTNVELLVAEFTPNVGQVYATGFRLSGVDWIGRSVQADGSGDAFVATVFDQGTGGNMMLVEVDPSGSSILDQQGDAYGSNDDQNRGLALDTTNNLAYMVGFTNSPDFNFTTGRFQSTYGGDPYDGVIIQDQLM